MIEYLDDGRGCVGRVKKVKARRAEGPVLAKDGEGRGGQCLDAKKYIQLFAKTQKMLTYDDLRVLRVRKGCTEDEYRGKTHVDASSGCGAPHPAFM